MDRHIQDNYFKIHGYPNWYKNLNEQKAKNSSGSRQVANVAETLFDENGEYVAVGTKDAYNQPTLLL